MNKLFVCNLKMKLSVKDMNKYVAELASIRYPELVICPTSIYIPFFLNYGYSVGLQNCCCNDIGPYTGETSPKDAYNLGVRYTLVGHCDVRTNNNESDVYINKKVLCALKNKITPILCVGETLEEYDLLKTNRVIKRQIVNALRDVVDVKKVVIAYTPFWDAKIPSNDEIEKMIDFIKELVELNYKCSDIRVIYGGGVNERNIKVLNKLSNVDGFLIESSSLDTTKIKDILEVAV